MNPPHHFFQLHCLYHTVLLFLFTMTFLLTSSSSASFLYFLLLFSFFILSVVLLSMQSLSSCSRSTTPQQTENFWPAGYLERYPRDLPRQWRCIVFADGSSNSLLISAHRAVSSLMTQTLISYRISSMIIHLMLVDIFGLPANGSIEPHVKITDWHWTHSLSSLPPRRCLLLFLSLFFLIIL